MDNINVKNKRKTKSAKKDEGKELLKDASIKAVQLLIDALDNDVLSASARLDAAKEIINRVYGKSSAPFDEEEQNITVELKGETKDYAK